MMQSFQRTVRTSTEGGKYKAADEETLPFQGAAAGLKQNCGRHKAAGDGLQADAVADAGGMLKAFAFRGHSLLPTVTVKGKPHVKLSPLHQRTIFTFFLSGVTTGNVIGMDNLYNSVDFSHMLEKGETFLIDLPAGYVADVDYDGNVSTTPARPPTSSPRPPPYVLSAISLSGCRRPHAPLNTEWRACTSWARYAPTAAPRRSTCSSRRRTWARLSTTTSRRSPSSRIVSRCE